MMKKVYKLQSWKTIRIKVILFRPIADAWTHWHACICRTYQTAYYVMINVYVIYLSHCMELDLSLQFQWSKACIYPVHDKQHINAYMSIMQKRKSISHDTKYNFKNMRICMYYIIYTLSISCRANTFLAIS